MSNPCSCCYAGCWCHYDTCEDIRQPWYDNTANYSTHPGITYYGFGYGYAGVWVNKPYPKPITLAQWDEKLSVYLGPEAEVERYPNPCNDRIIHDGMDLLGYQSSGGEFGRLVSIGNTYFGVLIDSSPYPAYSYKYYEQYTNNSLSYQIILFKSSNENRKCSFYAKTIGVPSNISLYDPNDPVVIDLIEQIKSEGGWDLLDEYSQGEQNAMQNNKIISYDKASWPVSIMIGCSGNLIFGNMYYSPAAVRCTPYDYYYNGQNCLIQQCNFGKRGSGCSGVYVPPEGGDPINLAIEYSTTIKTTGQASWVSNPTILSTIPWCLESHGSNVEFTHTLTITNPEKQIELKDWGALSLFCICGIVSKVKSTYKHRDIRAAYNINSVSYFPEYNYGYIGYNYYYGYNCKTESDDPLSCENIKYLPDCIDNTDLSCCIFTSSLTVTPDKDLENCPWQTNGRSYPEMCGGMTNWFGYYGYWNYYGSNAWSHFYADNYPFAYSNKNSNLGYTIPGYWISTEKETSTTLTLWDSVFTSNDYGCANSGIRGCYTGCGYGGYIICSGTNSKPFSYSAGSVIYKNNFTITNL